MPYLPRRLRLPRAEVRIELEKPSPPESSYGGELQLRIELLPFESFSIETVRTDLALLTTRFSRTVLDGYQEHTQELVLQSAVFFKKVTTHPGDILLHAEELRLPAEPEGDARPARRELQATVRFKVCGHRELRATRILRDLIPSQGDAPVVDGRGFLPY